MRTLAYAGMTIIAKTPDPGLRRDDGLNNLIGVHARDCTRRNARAAKLTGKASARMVRVKRASIENSTMDSRLTSLRLLKSASRE